jgi:hypothetical protein
MRYQDQAKTLFQLTTELTDSKVEIAVSKAISQVVDQIVALRQEVHREIGGLRHEIHEIGTRLSFVETALGFRNQSRQEIRNRFYDYAFKAGWLILGSIITYLAVQFHILL